MRAGLVCLMLLAAAPALAEGGLPDEVGVFWLTIYDDITDLGDSWSGMGARAGWKLLGPLIAEADVWKASDEGRDGASGAMLSGKFLLEGLVTGVYARGGLARYRGETTLGVGAGIEVYIIKKLLVRGEALYLQPGDRDLGFSVGVGFRL